MATAGIISVKSGLVFFDRAPVMDAFSRVQRRNLSRVGGWIRKTARRSIRRRKKASAPGRPPHKHGGHSWLTALLVYGWDPASESVVIGPQQLNKVSFTANMTPVRGTVPSVLEYGGAVHVLEEWTGRGWRRKDLRRRGSVADVAALRESGRDNVFRKRPIRKRRVRVAARPFMAPALLKAKQDNKLAEAWKNSVRGTGL